jgi:hypothetical protein
LYIHFFQTVKEKMKKYVKMKKEWKSLETGKGNHESEGYNALFQQQISLKAGTSAATPASLRGQSSFLPSTGQP